MCCLARHYCAVVCCQCVCCLSWLRTGTAAHQASCLLLCLACRPFDVIKTYIQTHGAIGAAASSSSSTAGLSHSMGLFLSTAKALVAKGGPQALFVGLVPRLAHQVPGECTVGQTQAARSASDLLR